MKSLIYIVGVVLCLQGQAQESLVLKGSVMDDHGLAVPGATVFLNGTKWVTASDTGGKFILANVKPRDYKLIVKAVGFKTLVKDVVLSDRPLQLSLQLESDAKYLKAVTVRPDRSWLKNVEIFKQQFLGESDNAMQCKLVNPGVLNFTYDKHSDDLSVTADDLLVIRNPQLGYELKYVLDRFVYNSIKGSVVYDGFPSFQELHGTQEEEAQWKANRRTAYLGSIHHFIHSVYDQNCKAEGFLVYKLRNRVPYGFPGSGNEAARLDYKPVSFDSLLRVADDRHKVLEFSDELYIVYTKEKEPSRYVDERYSLASVFATRPMPAGQVSIITGLGPAIIDESGGFRPTPALYFEGYMGWEKIGDLVPFEYDPTAEQP
jgi:hypothetical protein